MDHEQELAEAISKLADLSLVKQSPSHHMIISNLVRQARDGEAQRRRRALYQLHSRATEFGVDSVFHIVLMLSPGCRNHELLEALDTVLPVLDRLNLLAPDVHAVIELLHSFLMSDDPTDLVVSQRIFSSFALCNSVTVDVLIAANKPDIYAYDDRLRARAVRVFALVASAYGIPALLPLLGDVCSTTESSVVVRAAGMKIVEEIAVFAAEALVPHLDKLVRIVSLCFSGTNAWLMMPAALAIDTLARGAGPFGAESLTPAATKMRECMEEHLCCGSGYRLNVAVACAKTLGSLVGLMEEPAKSSHARQLMEILSCDKLAPLASGSADAEMRESVLVAYLQCFRAGGVAADDVRRWMEDDVCLFKCYFTESIEFSNCGLPWELISVIQKKIGSAEFHGRILKWVAEAKVDYNMAELLLHNLKMA